MVCKLVLVFFLAYNPIRFDVAGYTHIIAMGLKRDVLEKEINSLSHQLILLYWLNSFTNCIGWFRGNFATNWYALLL